MRKPNFNDSRNLDAAKRAIRFAETFFKGNQVKAVSRTMFYDNIGNTSRTPCDWLKDYLFETHDSHYNMVLGKCKTYRVKSGAVQKLQQELGLSDVYQATDDIQQQIDTGEFEYAEKSDRYYTQVQFIPSTKRQELLADNGYRFLYDIEAAAPTILFQRARQVNIDFAAPALQNYITDRTQVRLQVAEEASVSAEQVKLVINALLQGSVLSVFHTSKLYQELGSDYALMQRLKQSQTLTALRDDIKSLWKCLRNEFDTTYYFDKNNIKKAHKVNARDKSAYYRKFEKQIARVIQRYLNKNKVRYLWVHDGWQCDTLLDSVELVSRVRQQTGFVIQLDYTMLVNKG